MNQVAHFSLRQRCNLLMWYLTTQESICISICTLTLGKVLICIQITMRIDCTSYSVRNKICMLSLVVFTVSVKHDDSSCLFHWNICSSFIFTRWYAFTGAIDCRVSLLVSLLPRVEWPSCMKTTSCLRVSWEWESMRDMKMIRINGELIHQISRPSFTWHGCGEAMHWYAKMFYLFSFQPRGVHFSSPLSIRIETRRSIFLRVASHVESEREEKPRLRCTAWRCCMRCDSSVSKMMRMPCKVHITAPESEERERKKMLFTCRTARLLHV